jgi:membrane-associated PAP2 superfamily phosphatase
LSNAVLGPRRLRWFYLCNAAVLAIAAIVLGALFHFTRLDLQLAAPYYDPVNHTFPWRYAWVSKYFVHRYMKYALLALGIGVWLLALKQSWRPASSGFFASHRRRWWMIAWSFVLVPLVIGLLRRESAMHCPWEITDFGGYAPYFDLLSPVPAGLRGGRCFPAAFVASGSWTLAFALLWYPERRRLAFTAGLATLALAFALGWVQQMRGAHFLSHTLWSLWISWAVVLLVHAATGAGREGATASADPSSPT